MTNSEQMRSRSIVMHDELVAIRDYVDGMAKELNGFADVPSSAGYEIAIAAKKLTYAVDALRDEIDQM